LFAQTKRRFTILISGILAVILLTLVLLFYLILSSTATQNEKAQTAGVYEGAMREMQSHPEDMLRVGPAHENDSVPGVWDFLHPGQFAVSIRGDGKLLAFGIDQTLAKEVRDRVERHEGTATATTGEFRFNANQRCYLVVVYSLSQWNMPLYAGVDITSDDKLLKQMRWLLSGAAGFFLLAAVVAGYVLSGRIMRPVIRAYKRQQDFTSDASHELRTPLSILRSSIEILDEQKEKLSGFHQTVLANMEDEVERMIRMTESLLIIARADAEELKDARSSFVLFDLKETAAGALRQMDILSRTKGIRLLLDEEAPGTIYGMQGNKEQIHQLIVILLDNGIKYSPSGGEVAARLSVRGKDVVLQIRDNGIGLAADEIPRIFGRFYRVDKGRSRELGGTGLGLSIAAEIVRIHGGSIKAASEPGKGSVFTVTFPSASS
jgi:signal transduction histidine kinase